jgi:hypothetical protein
VTDTHLATATEPALRWWMESETAPTDPVCPTCSKAVTVGSLVLFQHGELIHVRCASAEALLRAMEQSEGGVSVQATVEENVVRAKRLSEEAAWARRKEFGSCGNCGQIFRPGGGYIRRSDGRPVHLSCSRPR